MNIVFDIKFEKLNELCDQIFDYFYLSYYDMESKFNNDLNIESEEEEELKEDKDTLEQLKRSSDDFEGLCLLTGLTEYK